MSAELKSCFATLPRTERGTPIVLGGDPKGKNFLYCNGTSVIIRDIANPAISDIYTEHAATTTVAKYSPSGFYIASADKNGKVRIWDTTQKEHILKNEFQPFSGPVKDLAWTFDNQRMVVVGEGRETFGHFFNSETGTSVGDFMGHSKIVNSVDLRPGRPFRAVSGGDDQVACFYHGVPFKFQNTIRDHTRFVNSVRYAPNGEVFVTGGADGNIFVYDGKTGEKKGELGSPAHKGGIYAVSFSPDSRHVLSASGDKTCKIFDVETSQVVNEFVLGKAVEDMQVGCLWQGDYLLSVSVSGHINYHDKNSSGGKPTRIVKGHNKPITALAIGKDKTIFTGASDGQICYWDSETGENDLFPGSGHKNQVQDMAIADGQLYTIGMDDTLMVNSADGKTYGPNMGAGERQSVKMPSQPRGLCAISGGLCAIACYTEIVLLRGVSITYTQKAMYEPTSVSIHPNLSEIAVGGNDNRVHVYSLAGDTLTPQGTYDHTGPVLDVQYSPDGAFLATCDGNRKVGLYDVQDKYKVIVSTEWVFHSARVNTGAWTEDSGHLATGALDTNILVWDPADRKKRIMVKGAHPMSQITRVRWLDSNTLVSVGQDSNTKQWKVSYA